MRINYSMTNRSRVAFSVIREHRGALPELPPKDAAPHPHAGLHGGRIYDMALGPGT